jgi:hypothetical protein
MYAMRSAAETFAIFLSLLGLLGQILPTTWWVRVTFTAILMIAACDLFWRLPWKWIRDLPEVGKIYFCLVFVWIVLIIVWGPIRQEYLTEANSAKTYPPPAAPSPSASDIASEVIKQLPQPKVEEKSAPKEPQEISRPTKSKPIVKVHFKESPLFTEQRRQLIQKEIDSFYEYLSSIGYQLSKELPPLGVRSTMLEVTMIPESIYDAQINFPESGIDNLETIRSVYAHHVFRKKFGMLYNFESSTESIFSQYYVSSFKGTKPNELDDNKWPGAKWVNALWDIRTAYSQDFADRLLFYVAEQWSKPGPGDLNFDKFFMQRFLAGLFVIDNAGQNEPKIREILKKRGLSMAD